MAPCDVQSAETVEECRVAVAVMMAGLVGAAATLACLLPGLDSFFEW